MTLRTAQQQGQMAEDYALAYLQKKGLQLLTRNFRCFLGEIDLIMQDANTLVFIEVRCRKNKEFGHGFETITRSKQRKLSQTALFYLKQRKLMDKIACRFDVVAMHTEDQEITWIKNAFMNTY